MIVLHIQTEFQLYLVDQTCIWMRQVNVSTKI